MAGDIYKINFKRPFYTSDAVEISVVPDAVTVQVADVKNSNMKFALRQNYPNPFNPSTDIEYCIEQKGSYTLRVFDMIGREVALLVSGDQQPGIHKVRFNAAGLSSGVYVYSLSGNGKNLSKKLLLLK